MAPSYPYFANRSFFGAMKETLLLALVFLSAIVLPQPAFANEPDGQTSRKASASFPKPSDRKPIRFEYARGVVVFEVIINGREGLALLDSGAGSSSIDLNFAREAGLTVGAQMTPVRPGVGPALQTLSRYRIDTPTTIVFPGQMTVNAPLPAMDMGSLSAILDTPVIMLVGADFLSNLAVQVDFRQGALQFAPSGALALPDRQSFVDLTDAHRQLTVKIGDRPFGLAIDLGFNGWISLNANRWKEIEKAGTVRSRNTKNASGESFSTKSAHMHRIDVGQFPVWNLEVEEEFRASDKRDGVVGMGFMRKFDAFILDLKARKLWLQPRAD